MEVARAAFPQAAPCLRSLEKDRALVLPLLVLAHVLGAKAQPPPEQQQAQQQQAQQQVQQQADESPMQVAQSAQAAAEVAGPAAPAMPQRTAAEMVAAGARATPLTDASGTAAVTAAEPCLPTPGPLRRVKRRLHSPERGSQRSSRRQGGRSSSRAAAKDDIIDLTQDD
ncbi:hypothetical protein ABPG75_013952 [Micractinium tetrahymenae]